MLDALIAQKDKNAQTSNKIITYHSVMELTLLALSLFVYITVLLRQAQKSGPVKEQARFEGNMLISLIDPYRAVAERNRLLAVVGDSQ